MPIVRNICLIDPQPMIVSAFKEAGHTVLVLMTGQALFYNLHNALSEHGFQPDLVIQTETLSERSMVTGLDQIDCPTIFWAMDPHLNAHWQAAYARLFDMTCSTQQGWIPRLKGQGAPDVRWLPMFGRARQWVEIDDRPHDITFVGRVSRQRPARAWMVAFLQAQRASWDVAIEHSLDFGTMMDLYERSRVIPNESIFGEVNFRLFEGASCGCLVLGQNLGAEQASLFEPGREFDTYTDIVELDEKLKWYLNSPRLIRTMGRAARERVLAEHLPEHRAAQLLVYAADCVRHRATGDDVPKWQILTVVAMWEAGIFPVKVTDIMSLLSSVPADGAIAAATMRVQAVSGAKSLLAQNVRSILGGDCYADSIILNLTGSMAALAVDHWDAAKAFWYRYLKGTGGREQVPPQDRIALLTMWAKELKRKGLLVRAGFSFDPVRHLPQTAAECLMLILQFEPEHLPTLRLLDTILRPIVGLEQARVGFLSILTLHERQDWRLSLEIALVNLKSYRLESGLEELHLAHSIACRHGQETAFLRALKARDLSGRLVTALRS